MRDQPDSSLPPPSALNALRQPRRVQLGDPCVKALLAEWKRREDPIEYADLNRVAALIRVENPSARTRREIVAAVEAAGIEIRNYDDFREWLAESGAHVQLTGQGWVKQIEEMRWRWPETRDDDNRRQRATCHHVRRGRLEYILEHEHVEPGDEILPWPDCEERWL